MTRLPDQRMPTGFALVTSPGTDFRVETRINQTFPRSNRKASAHATSGRSQAARIVKLQGGGFIDLWKGTGAPLQIWSWAQQGARERPKTWQLIREAL